MSKNTNGKKNGQRRQRRSHPPQGKALPMTFSPAVQFKREIFGFVSTQSLTEPAAFTGTFYQYRLNSLYDPDYTGVGTVAQGYTTYSALYNTFRVLRVRVVVRFFQQSTGQVTVGLIPSLNTSATSNFVYLEGQPFAKSKLLEGNTGGQHSVWEYNTVIDLPKVCGLTKAQYMNDMDFTHTVGTNPARTVYLALYSAGHSGQAQTTGFTVRFVYEVEMSQPLDTVVN